MNMGVLKGTGPHPELAPPTPVSQFALTVATYVQADSLVSRISSIPLLMFTPHVHPHRG